MNCVDNCAKDDRVQVAIAILYQDNRFLMQLRDNDPRIVHPGCWGFFGGHIEPGESPKIAVQRELVEEIGYTMPSVTKFEDYSDEKVIRHVFHAPLTVGLEKLVLMEGWDLGLLSVEDIIRGDCFSDRANQVRPLGTTHRQILLDFIEANRPIND